MRFDDGAADREPQAHPLRLGRHERLEDALQVLGPNTRAAVGDGHDHARALPAAAAHSELSLRLGPGHGVAAVDEEIQQHLLQLDPIARHGGKLRREVNAYADLTVDEVATHEREYLLDHLVHVDRLVLRFFLPQHGAQPRDDRAGPLVARDDVGEDLRDLIELRRVAGKKPLGRLCIAENRRQRLVQLVRKRAGQLAQHRYAREVRHLVALAGRFALAALALADVDHGGDHEPALGGLHRIQTHLHRQLGPVLADGEEVAARPHRSWLPFVAIRLAVRGVRIPKAFRHQHLHRLPDQVLARIPEHRLGARVGQHDDPVDIDDEHRVRRRFHQRPEALFGLPARRDVMGDTAHAGGRSSLVALDPAARCHPAHASVREHDAELLLEVIRPLGQRRAHAAFHRRPVVGIHAFQEAGSGRPARPPGNRTAHGIRASSRRHRTSQFHSHSPISAAPAASCRRCSLSRRLSSLACRRLVSRAAAITSQPSS